ncbi:MAG: hypothetical protein O7E52_08595 [Candidatus Poribacteria bacterium]|nr:hypothetical protein [Candidatus Poribacteria bacterium]
MPKYPIDKLIADFDETISEQDTISLIVHATADNRRNGKSQFLADWREMVKWYSTRYQRIRNQWLADEQSIVNRQKPALERSEGSIVDFLKAFEEVESASIERVIEKGFLAGLTEERLRAVGRNVVKKTGVGRVLASMRTAGVQVEIISANWSKALIEGAMGGLYDWVITNALVYDAAGLSTGGIHQHSTSARDKLRHFRQRKCVRPLVPPSPGGQGEPVGQTLYIGDSISDFLAILEADVGVLIGDNRTAMQTIKRFQLPTQQIREGAQFDPARHYQGTILRVDSWATLNDFLVKAGN